MPKLYDPQSKDFDHSSFRRINLTCRDTYTTADGVEIPEGDYNGFEVRKTDGERQIFLKLRAIDSSYDAFEITKEVSDGRYLLHERESGR